MWSPVTASTCSTSSSGARAPATPGPSSSGPSRGSTIPRSRPRCRRCSTDVAGLDDVTKVDSPYVEGGEQLIASTGARGRPHRLRQRGAARGERLQPGRRDPGHHPRGVTGDRRRRPSSSGATSSPSSRSRRPRCWAWPSPSSSSSSPSARCWPWACPIGVALFGIGVGSAFDDPAEQPHTIPDFAPFIGVMIGLGVGIDYALFIVTRLPGAAARRPHVRESIRSPWTPPAARCSSPA